MSWRANPYDSPEKFDLTIVGEVEWSEPCYTFDRTVVWQDEFGTLYWASDSGCSCPSPFEDHNSLSDLETGDKFELAVYLEGQRTEYGSAAMVDLLAKVMSQ